MNQLTDQQLYNLMPESISVQHDAALLQYGRAVIEAEHKRLLGVGMEPVAWNPALTPLQEWVTHLFDGFSQLIVNAEKRCEPYGSAPEKSMRDAFSALIRQLTYTADQLAAARLQDQQRIAELEAQLAERKPLTDWQPIETAPRDGKRVIIRGYGTTQVAGYMQVPGCEFYAWVIANDVHIEDNFATHWMHLQISPSEAAHGIGDKA